MSKFAIILSAVFLISEANLHKNLNSYGSSGFIAKKITNLEFTKNVVDDLKNKWINLEQYASSPTQQGQITFGQYTLDDIQRKKYYEIIERSNRLMRFLKVSENLPSAYRMFSDDVSVKTVMERKERTEKIMTDAMSRGINITDCLVQFNDLTTRESQTNLKMTLCRRYERIIVNAYVTAVLSPLDKKLPDCHNIKLQLQRYSNKFRKDLQRFEVNASENANIELQKSADELAKIEVQVPEILETTMKTIEANLDDSLVARFVDCNVEKEVESFNNNADTELDNIWKCVHDKLYPFTFNQYY